MTCFHLFLRPAGRLSALLFCGLAVGGCTTGAGRFDTAAPKAASTATPLPTPALPAAADLPALIRYTLAHHPRMQAAAADLRAAEAEAVMAGALMDPVLGFSQSVAGEEEQSVSLQQSLPLFGQRRLARQQGHYRAQAVAAGLDQVRLDLILELVAAYAEYAYIVTAGQILMEQEQLSRQLMQVVEIRYRTGGAQQAPLLRMQNEVDNLARERLDLDELAQAAGASLNAALGRPFQAGLPTVELGRENLNDLPDNLQERLLKHNPRLRAIALELEADEAAQRLAGRAGLPELMLGVEVMRNPMMGGTSTNLMAGFTLPVWRSNYRAQQDRADAAYQSRGLLLQDQQLQLQAQLKMAEYRLREARRRRQLYGEVLQVRAGQAFASTRTAYQSGAASFADLVDSQRELLAFRLGHVRAQADALVAAAQLLALVDLDPIAEAAGGDDE